MAISQYTDESDTPELVTLATLHGIPRAIGPPELPLVRHLFADLVGEVHQIGRPGGQQLTCDVMYAGAETFEELLAWTAELDRQAGQLTGALSVTLPGDETLSWPPSTFLGFRPAGPPRRDGTGTLGHFMRGTLHWIVRRPPDPPPDPGP